MKKTVSAYSFNAAARTVTFTGYPSINLQNVLLIANTTDNLLLYNFADPAMGGTVAGNVLTLLYNTSAMSNTDALLIYYEDDAVVPALSSDIQEANSLAMALLEAIAALRFLGAMRDTNSALRVNIASTIATLSTVTTLTSMSQIAGQPLNGALWSVSNGTAVLSNIQNVLVP